MVSIKEATERAMSFAQEALGPQRTQGLRLEEIESTTLSTSDDCWLITLSMLLPDLPNTALSVLQKRETREYKTFTVRKHDGEVISMKIREMADA